MPGEMTFEWKPNPHVWRKFAQAQTNMLRAMNFTRDSESGARQWNGNNRPMKTDRRCRKWARQMKRWSDKLF